MTSPVSSESRVVPFPKPLAANIIAENRRDVAYVAQNYVQ